MWMYILLLFLQMNFRHPRDVYWFSWPHGQSLENFVQTSAREVISHSVDDVLGDVQGILSSEIGALQKALEKVEDAGETLCKSLEPVAGSNREAKDLTRLVIDSR